MDCPDWWHVIIIFNLLIQITLWYFVDEIWLILSIISKVTLINMIMKFMPDIVRIEHRFLWYLIQKLLLLGIMRILVKRVLIYILFDISD